MDHIGAPLMRNKHMCATAVFDCPDGSIALNMGEGGMVGDHGGPIEFMHPFCEHVDAWIEPLQQIEHNKISSGISIFILGSDEF